MTFGPGLDSKPVVSFSRGQIVFVYYYIQIGRPVDSVEQRFRSFLSSFNTWAEDAYRDGEELTASISVGSGPAAVAKTVRMRVGDPVTADSETTVPVVWEATGVTSLFPKMEGNLILAAIGPDFTQLSFRGDYEPPLGALGRALDRVLMHRLAESSVKGFVDRIGLALESD
jgi:hypothetical protein